MKSRLLVLPVLLVLPAFAVGATTFLPASPVPAPKAYTPPVSEPLPPVAVLPPPQPIPPPQPQIVLPQPVEEPLTSLQILEGEDDEPGFIVQNGYDGYIVPAELLTKSELPPLFPLITGLLGLIKLPKFLFALWPMVTNGLFALGAIGAVGAAVCTFTPFCGITLFGLRSNEVKNALKSDVAKSAVEFITNSIDKYRSIVKQIEDAAAENVARKSVAKASSKKRRR